MQKQGWICRIITATAILLLSCDITFADGVIRDAIGAVTTGRGGTNLGFADNGQMILDNPAAIVNMPTFRLSEFDVDVLFTDLDYSDSDNAKTRADDNPFPMGQFSLALKSPSADLGLGLGVFSQAGFASEYHLNGPFPFSGPQHYKSLGALVRFLSAASWRVNSRLSVGANLGVAASHIELEGPYFLQGPNPFAGTPTLLDFQGTGAALSWAAGLQYQLFPSTTVGINYQARTDFSLNGNTFVQVPGLAASRFDSNLDVAWPQSLGFGVKHDIDCCTRIGLDFTWFDWSNAFDSFALTIRDAENPVLAGVVGPELVDRLPLNWRDSLSVKTGVERNLANGRVVRAGYIYHRNPIPEETLNPFLQTTLEHAFSVGYGWLWKASEIDVAYQYSFADDQSVVMSQFLGGDFDNSTVGTQAHWLSISSIRRF